MKSFDQIKDLMRVQQHYWWTLTMLDGRREVNLGAYDDGSSGDEPVSKKGGDMSDKAIVRLEQLVNTMDDGSTVFSIMLKRTKTSHQDGAIGPFEFQTNPSSPSAPPSNLSGIPTLGQFTQEQFDRAVKAEAGYDKVTFQQAQLDRERAEFEAYKRMKTEALEADERSAAKRREEIIAAAKEQAAMIVELERKAWETEKKMDIKLLEVDKKAWEEKKDQGKDYMPVFREGIQTLQMFVKSQNAPAAGGLGETERNDPLFLMVDKLCEELMETGDPRIVAAVGAYFQQVKAKMKQQSEQEEP